MGQKAKKSLLVRFLKSVPEARGYSELCVDRFGGVLDSQCIQAFFCHGIRELQRPSMLMKPEMTHEGVQCRIVKTGNKYEQITYIQNNNIIINDLIWYIATPE